MDRSVEGLFDGDSNCITTFGAQREHGLGLVARASCIWYWRVVIKQIMDCTDIDNFFALPSQV